MNFTLESLQATVKELEAAKQADAERAARKARVAHNASNLSRSMGILRPMLLALTSAGYSIASVNPYCDRSHVSLGDAEVQVLDEEGRVATALSVSFEKGKAAQVVIGTRWGDTQVRRYKVTADKFNDGKAIEGVLERLALRKAQRKAKQQAQGEMAMAKAWDEETKAALAPRNEGKVKVHAAKAYGYRSGTGQYEEGVRKEATLTVSNLSDEQVAIAVEALRAAGILA